MYVGGNVLGENEDSKKEVCFVIMPISDQGDYPEGHFKKVYEQIFKPAIEAAGYEAFRVDENKICDSIMKKIFDAIYNCPMALCDLSNRNPNVLYELGLRQAYDKPVVLVQDDKTERIFDISGINTVSYKSNRLYENILEAREKIKEAIMSTKEGKETSVIKIWQAVAADISHDNMSREDKLEIMIRGIMRDIQDLKQEREIDSKHKKRFRIIDDEPYSFNNVAHSEWFVVELKTGVTNKEIKSTLNRIREMYDSTIKEQLNGSKLYVYFSTTDIENITGCFDELSKLGNTRMQAMA